MLKIDSKLMLKFWKNSVTILDKVFSLVNETPNCGAIQTNRGAILPRSEHYIRLHSSIFRKGFKRENLEKPKDVTLGLSVFGERFLCWETLHKHHE